GGSIRFSTAALRSGEYPTSSSYPAHLKNKGKVEQRTTSLTRGARPVQRQPRERDLHLVENCTIDLRESLHQMHRHHGCYAPQIGGGAGISQAL
ncbi:hypothetical protein, partial [Paracoccus gahaiensis]|uniref:hypothetical protein n=1 Tax=Paracoccus gahaiensis TaxID=1706839 RepID=UPI001B7F97FD